MSVLISSSLIAEPKRLALKFNIKPRICVLAQGEEYCKDKIDARWSTKNKKKITVCLYKEESDLPLKCWENRRSGVYKIPIQTQQSLVFTLRDEPQKQFLAKKEFEVVHDSKRYRRSRRNPWSFF